MECLGFELGAQDGRRRRNHGAMAATSTGVLVYPCNQHHGCMLWPPANYGQ